MESHLKDTYGFNNFREYQKDIIQDLLNGENVYLTDRGKYIVKNVDENGIHTHGKHGYDYLYMGKKCPSEILDSITKAPHKIILIRSESHPNHVSPKRTRW